MEVWNNVFSQFDNDGHNNYTELKQKNIDTGMGLERLAVVCQDVNSLFDVDTVMNITNKVSELTGAFYGKSTKMDVSLRVITDHIRSSVFMICDGVLPSNEGRGYVLRRLLRRAARHGKLLGVNEPFLYKVIATVVHENECQYPELREKEDYITRVIKTEEENFAKTIDAGMKIFSELLAEHKEKGESVFSGADAFKLYDTYGFPIDLTIEMCEDEGMSVNEAEFKSLMEEQRVRAREARKALGDLGWAGVEFGKAIPDTVFDGYEHNDVEGRVMAIVADGEFVEELKEGAEAIVVLDKTALYAEMGGQVGDHGKLTVGESTFKVTNVAKNKGGKFMHYGVMEQGTLEVGNTAVSHYCEKRRNAVRRAHSATHMLQYALRTVLGDHVHQAGSLVEPDFLRFDFTHFSAVTAEQLKEIEALVNAAIAEGHEVNTNVMSIEEAKNSGAMALFGEKYGDSVRVVDMGVSKELCGGTHLDNTAKAGAFHIVSESSVASGVRRIEATTGAKTLELLNSSIDRISNIAVELKSSTTDIEKKIESLMAELKEANRVIEQYKAKESAGGADGILKAAAEIGGLKVAAVKVTEGNAQSLRQLGDMLRDKEAAVVAVVVLVADGKVTLQCVCGKDAVAKGIKAGDIIKTIAPVVSGKGGGKPDSAMGGGSDVTKVDEALAMVSKIVAEKIG